MLKKAMVPYTKPQHRKKKESEQLRGERDKIKFINELVVGDHFRWWAGISPLGNRIRHEIT